MEALGETTRRGADPRRLLHEPRGLNLHYESAQTRQVPRRKGWYDLTTHFPWIGERTRALDGAHVEFFRGIENPVGIKLGPTSTADQVLRPHRRAQPRQRAGQDRPGHAHGGDPRGRRAAGPRRGGQARRAHASSGCATRCTATRRSTPSGLKTRDFDDILREVETTVRRPRRVRHVPRRRPLRAHRRRRHRVHRRRRRDHRSTISTRTTRRACDPRLNYRQALEMGFRLAKRLGRHPVPAPRESTRALGLDHPVPADTPSRSGR